MLDVQAQPQGQRIDGTPSLLVMSVNENAQCISDCDMPALCDPSDSERSEGDEIINLFNSRSERNHRRNIINDKNTSAVEQARLLREQTVADVHLAALEGRVARM